MRDAFGGSFMIQVFLIFIIIYVGFIAVALNYAKAFKAKNAVIAYLEDNEIPTIKRDEMPATERTKMEEYFEQEVFQGMNYYYDNINCNIDTSAVNVVVGYCENGIMIEQISPYTSETNPETNKDGVYYRVSTYFGWSIPFINSLREISGRSADTVSGYWKISGESRMIVGSY